MRRADVAGCIPEEGQLGRVLSRFSIPFCLFETLSHPFLHNFSFVSDSRMEITNIDG